VAMNRNAAVQKNSARPADSRLHMPPGALASCSGPILPSFLGRGCSGVALVGKRPASCDSVSS
jgi:hypothetical protein